METYSSENRVPVLPAEPALDNRALKDSPLVLEPVRDGIPLEIRLWLDVQPSGRMACHQKGIPVAHSLPVGRSRLSVRDSLHDTAVCFT